MADLRALLAAERKTRQVAHPLASYDKSGALICTACDLKIPAEKLWDPHLRSANHRKNALAQHDGRPVSKKRKIGSDNEDEVATASPAPSVAIEEAKRIGKRTKSVRFAVDDMPATDVAVETGIQDQSPNNIQASEDNLVEERPDTSHEANGLPATSDLPLVLLEPDPVDEDEWAAFERDLATVTDAQGQTTINQEDRYAAATISAPAVSATELAQRQKRGGPAQSAPDSTTKTKRRDYEAEAQDEREEEQARIADEFAVMEEMEDKVRRLRQMRESLRQTTPLTQTRGGEKEGNEDGLSPALIDGQNHDREGDPKMLDADGLTEQRASVDEDEDESDEVDDWYS